MRKIKDCIKDSVDKYNGVLPICLAEFLRGMTVILLMDCEQRLIINNPDVKIGKDEYFGKAKIHPNFLDYRDVLIGNDLLRHTTQGMQLHGFMEWFIEQDEPADDEEMKMWYDLEFILGKWIEYAMNEVGKRG